MLQQILKQYWGYDQFLPLQREAMELVLTQRDSVVILPTGGGKSLCYQVPALCQPGMLVVVSPLIALMKDQVDSLQQCGIPAFAIHSGMSAEAKRNVVSAMQAERVKVFYTSPEQLLTTRSLDFLANIRLSAFAIDEAHCISAWGHDFRPEYRGLSVLRDRFPTVSFHAYTATATPQVCEEIVTSLGMRAPKILVGSFFRPNLVYRVARRDRLLNQLCNLLDRYRRQSGLIYCISRADTERLASSLQELGYSCTAYHAGLSEIERNARQEQFLNDQVDTMIATVAFGMGIDKSNVRFVIHAAMPKSMANYQQETGRAGRDGLEAECWLLYGSEDMLRWRRTFEGAIDEVREAGEQSLRAIYSYCVASHCRHRLLVEHFGQVWGRESCQACDVCLGQFEAVEQPLLVGQKILSCILRTNEQFGSTYVAQVLAGSKDKRILANRHDRLSTYGLLKDFRSSSIRDWIEQLIEQGFVKRLGEYQQLHVSPTGRELLHGKLEPRLMRPIKARAIEVSSPSLLHSWEGVDRELFDRLRRWRSSVSVRRGVAPFLVFSDATLRDLARRQPQDVNALRDVHGIGERKVSDFGKSLLELIHEYRQSHPVDQSASDRFTPIANDPNDHAGAQALAYELFEQGASIEQIAVRLGRVESTIVKYLTNYLQCRQITDPHGWVEPKMFQQIELVARYSGVDKLKPIHDAFHGRIDYDTLRIAAALIQNRRTPSL